VPLRVCQESEYFLEKKGFYYSCEKGTKKAIKIEMKDIPPA